MNILEGDMANLDSAICVVGSGARTAVGESVPATAAAVRAGVAVFVEHPDLVDGDGEPYIVAPVTTLPDEATGDERLFELALSAAREALIPLAASDTSLPRVRLTLGLPADRPGLPERLGRDLGDRLNKALTDSVKIIGVETIAAGHAAGLMALEAAWRSIRDGATDCFLVGGVDSYLDSETLEWLEQSEQIHSARQNAWGFVPGEAAGFCLVCSRHTADRLRLEVLANVVSAATGREENLIKTDAVCIGQGLTAAFREAVAALPDRTKIDQIICDMNGEPYRADEFGFTIVRTSQHFVDAGAFLSPADCWGDVGAASGPLFLALAVAASRKGYSPGPRALLWASSEGGERSAVLIHLPQNSARH